MTKMKLSLNAEDFSCLVSGGILTIKGSGVELSIALQDIGYDLMLSTIEALMDGETKPYQHREKPV